MSHIVTIDTQLKSATAAAAACEVLKLAPPTVGAFDVFARKVEGLGIKLRGWKYPVVADLQCGRLAYDNYNGMWGKSEELDNFLQRYGVEAAREVALAQGCAVEETLLEDGVIELKAYALA